MAWDTDSIVQTEIIPKIREAARKANLQVIDLYGVFENTPGLFPDGVHPNAQGADTLAQNVHAAIVGKK